MPHPDVAIAELRAERDSLDPSADDYSQRVAAIENEIVFHDSRERPVAPADPAAPAIDRSAVILAELKAEHDRVPEDRRDAILAEIEAVEAARNGAEEAAVPEEETPVEVRKRVRAGRKGQAERATAKPDETTTDDSDDAGDGDGDND